MAFRVNETELPGVLVIETDVFADARGCFLEFHHAGRFREIGIGRTFVQDNFCHSTRGVLRGLHYQLGRPQAKLVAALRGEILDVAVDVRLGSPTFGKWVGMALSASNRLMAYVPEGFAHGYCVLSETADVFYKNTDFYSPPDERGVRWDDAHIGIAWPLAAPVLSPRDARLPLLSDVPATDLPRYAGGPPGR